MKQWLASLVALVLGAGGLPGAGGMQLHVLEGEGAIYPVGGLATRGISILVTDEAGKPVTGALVNFRLPEEGPGGVFGSGLRTQAVTTTADGRAAVSGMQWNTTAGSFEIRITAMKDQARAGIVATQHLTDALQAKSGGSGTFQASHHFFNKWVVIGLVVAAGAAGGVFLAERAHSSTPSNAITCGYVGNVLQCGAPPVPPTIGAPVISIGHP